MIPLLDLCRSETQSIGNLGFDFLLFPFTTHEFMLRIHRLYRRANLHLNKTNDRHQTF